MTPRQHPFERAGLGPAPFRFLGMSESVYQAAPGAPVQPGASCNYCGQAIRYVFHIMNANGGGFDVGSECVRRTHGSGSAIVRAADRALRDFQYLRRKEREQERIGKAREILASRPDYGRNRPHPSAWHARNGRTRRDYIDWIMEFGGNRAKLAIWRELQS